MNFLGQGHGAKLTHFETDFSLESLKKTKFYASECMFKKKLKITKGTDYIQWEFFQGERTKKN